MSLKTRVLNLLKENKSCRDNDLTLCTHVWNDECLEMGKVFTDLSAVMFIHYVTKGKLSKQQTILRYRRKLNEEHPELKGKSYKSTSKLEQPSDKKQTVVVAEGRFGRAINAQPDFADRVKKLVFGH